MLTESARVIWSTIGSVDTVHKALRSLVHRRVYAWCGSLRRSGSIDSQTLLIPSRYAFWVLLAAISMDPIANQAKPILKIAGSRLERVGVDGEWSA